MTESIIVTAIVFLVFAIFGIISYKAEKTLEQMNQGQPRARAESIVKKPR